MQPSQSRGKGTLTHTHTHSLSYTQQRERKNAVEQPSGDGRAASKKRGRQPAAQEHGSGAASAHLWLRAVRDPCNCRGGLGPLRPPAERGRREDEHEQQQPTAFSSEHGQAAGTVANRDPRPRRACLLPEERTQRGREACAQLTLMERLCESSGSYIFTNG